MQRRCQKMDLCVAWGAAYDLNPSLEQVCTRVHPPEDCVHISKEIPILDADMYAIGLVDRTRVVGHSIHQFIVFFREDI